MRRCFIAPLSALALGGGAAAQADEAPQVSEVVVTALNPTHTVNVGAFGAKDPLEVPLSIASFGQAEIQTQRARTIVEVLRNDPSVQESSVGGAYDNIRIRGFPVDWTNTLRVDGLSVAPFQDVPLELIDRVDVLKGPSGFLYGFNAPGGTVNYILKRPTAQPFLALTGELSSHDGYYASLDASSSFGPDQAVGQRLNLAYEKIGDFTHAGDLKRYLAGLAVDLRLSERLLLQLNAGYQSRDTAAQPLIGLQPDNSLPPKIDPRTLLGFPWLRYETEAYDFGGRLEYTLSDDAFAVLQVSRSVNDRTAAFVDIYSVAANGDILDGDYVVAEGQSFETTSVQAFVSDRFITGPLRHELVAGLALRDYDARQGGFFFEPLTVGNILRPTYSAPRDLPAPLPKAAIRNRQRSAFASDLISLGEQWQALVGLRYIDYSNRNWPAGAASAKPAYKKDAWVPSAALMYKPRPWLTAYFSYAQGLEEGGYAPVTTVNAGEALNPIKSTQYETGVKAAVSGVTFTAAAFEIEKGLEYIDAQNRYVQAGRQRHSGVELTAAGKPTERLNLIAGVAYLHTEQARTNDPSTEGKRTIAAPKWQANLYAEYALPAVEGLFVNGAAYYVSARPLDAQNRASAPRYTRVDAGVRYETQVAGQGVTLRAQVKNLFDKFYWQVGQGYASVIPGVPRTVYVSASLAF